MPDRDLFALPSQRCSMATANTGRARVARRRRLARSSSSSSALPPAQSDAKATALVVGTPTSVAGLTRCGRGGRGDECANGCKCGAGPSPVSGATKARVIGALGVRDHVHLATHGAADGVYLSGSTEAEGKLTMAEVQELNLPRKLVVLSECDSFKGELKADGVIGITRAFVAAGAPTLVASLWKVDDTATRTLMTRFYDALLGPEAAGDVAVALQAAMISMLREGYTVNEWAEFVVYGLASAAELGQVPV